MSYRLFGAETSAYSTKMRSYLKYKGVAFDWTPRTEVSEDEIRRVSRFPTLPVLVTASGFAVHDTTPMMEALEADSPEPSAMPADPALAFLVCVLEEYADAWLAKTVFHYRWTRKKDQRLAAQRAIDDYYVTTPPSPADRKAAEDRAIETMGAQLKTMQLEGELGDVLEKSLKRFIRLLDEHLKKHLFIFGERPSIADFAIAGQLIQMMKDPTPAKVIEKEGPFVAKWCEFMAAPIASGPYAALDDLKETLAPIFKDDLSVFFLRWAAENLESSLAGAETFTVTLGKDAVALVPLRSAARSFRELRRKFVGAQAIEALKAFTDGSETTVYLLRPQRVDIAPAAVVSLPADDTDIAAAAPEAGEGDAVDTSEGGKRRRRRRRRGGRDRAEGGAGETSADAAGDDSSHDSDGAPEEVSAEPAAAEAAGDTAED
jgi:glutathione S-transferase